MADEGVQVFAPNADFTVYTSVLAWEVDAWTSDSLDNKPFIALSPDGEVYITDPDLGRVIRFDSEGNFLQLWGGCTIATSWVSLVASPSGRMEPYG